MNNKQVLFLCLLPILTANASHRQENPDLQQPSSSMQRSWSSSFVMHSASPLTSKLTRSSYYHNRVTNLPAMKRSSSASIFESPSASLGASHSSSKFEDVVASYRDKATSSSTSSSSSSSEDTSQETYAHTRIKDFPSSKPPLPRTKPRRQPVIIEETESTSFPYEQYKRSHRRNASLSSNQPISLVEARGLRAVRGSQLSPSDNTTIQRAAIAVISSLSELPTIGSVDVRLERTSELQSPGGNQREAVTLTIRTSASHDRLSSVLQSDEEQKDAPSPLIEAIQSTQGSNLPASIVTGHPTQDNVFHFYNWTLELPFENELSFLFDDRFRTHDSAANDFFAHEAIRMTTGSILLFGGNGAVSSVIRKKTNQNQNNPLGISHVGMVIIATPHLIRDVIEIARRHGGLHYTKGSEERKKKMLDDIIQILQFCEPDDLTAFSLHSTGKRGVHIVPLQLLLARYDGNVFARILSTPVPLKDLLPHIIRELGKTYNANLGELAKSTAKANKHIKDPSKQFCSQAVASLLQSVGLLPDRTLANNFTPGDFCSNAIHDYLAGVADEESLLKSRIDYDGSCCLIS